MRSLIMQIAFIAGVIIYFALLISLLRKRTLTVKYSILWFAMGTVMLVLAAYPPILDGIAALLGFEVASNALFSVLFLLVLLILLSLSAALSTHQKQIKNMAQRIALLEKELKDRE